MVMVSIFEELTRERQRAEALAAHLRQLGIDPEQLEIP